VWFSKYDFGSVIGLVLKNPWFSVRFWFFLVETPQFLIWFLVFTI